MSDATMIDLTLTLDELTERYGPEDGQPARCICKDRKYNVSHGYYPMIWLIGVHELPCYVHVDGSSMWPFERAGVFGSRFVLRKPLTEAAELIAWCEAEKEAWSRASGGRADRFRRIAELLRGLRPQRRGPRAPDRAVPGEARGDGGGRCCLVTSPPAPRCCRPGGAAGSSEPQEHFPSSR